MSGKDMHFGMRRAARIAAGLRAKARGNNAHDAGQRRMAARIFDAINDAIEEEGGLPLADDLIEEDAERGWSESEDRIDPALVA